MIKSQLCEVTLVVTLVDAIRFKMHESHEGSVGAANEVIVRAVFASSVNNSGTATDANNANGWRQRQLIRNV